MTETASTLNSTILCKQQQREVEEVAEGGGGGGRGRWRWQREVEVAEGGNGSVLIDGICTWNTKVMQLGVGRTEWVTIRKVED